MHVWVCNLLAPWSGHNVELTENKQNNTGAWCYLIRCEFSAFSPGLTCVVCVCVSSCCTWSREWVWPRVVVVVVILPMAECSLFHFVLACLLLLPYVNFTSSNCTLADSIPAICIRSVFKTETHSGISTFVRHRQFHLQWRRNDKIGINCKRVIHMWMGLISLMVFRYISKSIPNSEYSVYTCLMVWRLVFREEWDGVWIIMLRRTFVFAAVVGDYRLMYIIRWIFIPPHVAAAATNRINIHVDHSSFRLSVSFSIFC